MIEATIAGAQWLGDEGFAVIFAVLAVVGLKFATTKKVS